MHCGNINYSVHYGAIMGSPRGNVAFLFMATCDAVCVILLRELVSPAPSTNTWERNFGLSTKAQQGTFSCSPESFLSPLPLILYCPKSTLHDNLETIEVFKVIDESMHQYRQVTPFAHWCCGFLHCWLELIPTPLCATYSIELASCIAPTISCSKAIAQEAKIN